MVKYLRSDLEKTFHKAWPADKYARQWYTWQPGDIIKVPDNFPKVTGLVEVSKKEKEAKEEK